jgi:hypothetical protein
MHGFLLALLTLLFALRVLGQALVAFFDVTWLPAMEQWFSGLIPYPALLIIQLLMLLLMIKVAAEIWRGRGFYAELRPHWSQFLQRFSAVYAGVMIVRYILTMTLQPEMHWFGGAIPIIFHFVLAAFIFVLGRYHRSVS